MPKVLSETTFDLSDYFNTYGFGDGGGDDNALEAGFKLLGTAQDTLTEELHAAGLVEYHVKRTENGHHHDLRLVIVNTEGHCVCDSAENDDLYAEFTEDGPITEDIAETMKGAFRNAYARFEQAKVPPCALVASLIEVLWGSNYSEPGKEWSADTLDEIVAILVRNGFGPPKKEE